MTKPAGRDEGNLTEDSKIKILCSNYAPTNFVSEEKKKGLSIGPVYSRGGCSGLICLDSITFCNFEPETTCRSL